MAQAVAYSASEEKMLESEQEAEIDGIDPWKAAMQGDLDALLQYIDDNGDVNQRDRDNNTPLHWACQESHFDIVGVLMSRNAAVDPVNDLQSTPLHYACREGNLDIVTGLINFNANLEARNKDNLSPLHVAAGMGHIEVTKRLLDNGAHMEAEDNALYTPLWRAAYYGHPEVVEVLLTKGANKLARNKKGRKPGDVFSPTVEDDKKERIKNMLGMGTGQAQDAPTSAAAVPVASSAGAAATATAVAKAVGRASAENSAATRANTSASSGVLHAAEGNGVAATVQPVAAPVYKPPVSDHRDPAPSAASLADSSYNYPDPSPANSPSSVMLNSTATVMSEVVVSVATRDGAAADKLGRVSNGEPAGMGKGNSASAGGLSLGENASRAAVGTAAGVQTTPSVNGAAEMNRLKSELTSKNQQIQQMNVKLEEYKDNMVKAQTNNTRELDNADVQVEEMGQRISQMETELERKKREVGETRREIEVAARGAEERIAQLEHDLRMARSQSSGCACTIS